MDAATSPKIRYPWSAPPEAGKAIEIANQVLWLRIPMPMMLDHVNAYALEDPRGWTIIDPGLDTEIGRRTWEMLLAGPLAGKPVTRVVVTHYHPDHIGLAGWFQARGAELWTTRTSWLFARMLVLDEHHVPAPETLAFWRAAGMDPALLERRSTERPMNFCDIVHPLPLGYRRILEGQRLEMGGRIWQVRIGHGHAPDHATFWSQNDDLVIGGDQLLPSISANLGVYASEPEADPVAEWLASCRAFAKIAEERHLVLPGHKQPFTGLPLRLEQMIENHTNALERLHALLSEPRIGPDCFATLFKRPIGEPEYGLALVETVAHLNNLLHSGRARRDLSEGGVWLWSQA